MKLLGGLCDPLGIVFKIPLVFVCVDIFLMRGLKSHLIHNGPYD